MTLETDEEAPGAPASKRRWWWIAGGGAVVLVIAGVVTVLATGVLSPTPEEPVSKPAPTATRTPAPSPEPAPTPEPAPLPAPAIDITSVQQMPYSEVWNPPDEGQYIWQIVDPAYGYPETGGTRYILAHACESQSCAGDSFRALHEGDTLTFLGETFQVQESREIMKVDIAAQDIWTHDPNRLVIITCIIDTTWDQSDRNDIIIATRVT